MTEENKLVNKEENKKKIWMKAKGDMVWCERKNGVRKGDKRIGNI